MKPAPAQRVINEWVERCETEQVLRKTSTNFQLDVSPRATGPYVIYAFLICGTTEKKKSIHYLFQCKIICHSFHKPLNSLLSYTNKNKAVLCRIDGIKQINQAMRSSIV